MFFFHMLRSSIHPMSNSCDVISHAWPKSCEISSLMTDTRNGRTVTAGMAKREVALVAARAAIPARKSRRAREEAGIGAPETAVVTANEGRHKFTTVKTQGGSAGCAEQAGLRLNGGFSAGNSVFYAQN